MTSNSSSLTQSSALSTQYSTAPTGEQFPLPTPQDEAAELQRLQALTATYTYDALCLADVIVAGKGDTMRHHVPLSPALPTRT